MISATSAHSKNKDYRQADQNAHRVNLITLNQIEKDVTKVVPASGNGSIYTDHWQNHIVKNNRFKLDSIDVYQLIMDLFVDAIQLLLLYPGIYTDGAKPKQ